ncbi:Dolichyl-phosphate-mannose-protein mannosyltransferase [Mucilaginibacter mallensis]|uniref:Dolichyl-phosphate-mannose-protein mannosyltransferase n=1 Tax=Mucilaginibacter mallensis TaxID=652787 RepID=A0A1H2AST1_MUCMA|nr:glycosyltransferase family 39 protein [Mucilaginibacter mallensis]SDT48596.1 Dolichyl-phosphate-mannose-protein mannosyltransferase [Mucilaginibacter mallensis]
MPELTANKTFQSNKTIWYFLLAWTALNIIQAYTLELHADEAYYWLYSRFLDWGYFDHPPMVALFIRFGDSIMHNELGLRILTITVSTASIYILWLILKKYNANARLFIVVISCMFMVHMYGFTTTPDAPLFFFAVVFYYFYQRYIDNDSWILALVLGLVVACLLYSKYHAVLLIGFTVLANLSLLKRWSFWFIVVLAAVLFIPHILWQVHHNFPSLNYHLSERSADKYHPEFTYLYPLGQILMAGPLVGWYLFYRGFSARVTDAFTRCLMVNSIGTPIFFLISSFRGEVQPQWTYIAFAPLILLILISFAQKPVIPKWFYPVAIINIVIIVAIRICLISGIPIGRLQSQFGFKNWSYVVKQKVGDHYVIFNEGFQNPSKYDYYNNTLKGFAYDSRYYRSTQFDIWPIEDSLQHKRVYYLLTYNSPGVTTDSIKVSAGTWYGGWVDDVRTYQKVIIDNGNYKMSAAPGQKIKFNLTITNPYPYAIDFSNKGWQHKVFMEACFFNEKGEMQSQLTDTSFNKIALKPGQSTHYSFTIVSPKQKGRYDLLFSLQTEPFVGSKNSRIVKFTVE